MTDKERLYEIYASAVLGALTAIILEKVISLWHTYIAGILTYCYSTNWPYCSNPLFTFSALALYGLFFLAATMTLWGFAAGFLIRAVRVFDTRPLINAPDWLLDILDWDNVHSDLNRLYEELKKM
jgi:hypothetical protein